MVENWKRQVRGLLDLLGPSLRLIEGLGCGLLGIGTKGWPLPATLPEEEGAGGGGVAALSFVADAPELWRT